MRVILTARQTLTPTYQQTLNRLVNILGVISKNPSNPNFDQYIFEAISGLMRCVLVALSTWGRFHVLLDSLWLDHPLPCRHLNKLFLALSLLSFNKTLIVCFVLLHKHFRRRLTRPRIYSLRVPDLGADARVPFGGCAAWISQSITLPPHTSYMAAKGKHSWTR